MPTTPTSGSPPPLQLLSTLSIPQSTAVGLITHLRALDGDESGLLPVHTVVNKLLPLLPPNHKAPAVPRPQTSPGVTAPGPAGVMTAPAAPQGPLVAAAVAAHGSPATGLVDYRALCARLAASVQLKSNSPAAAHAVPTSHG